MGFAFCFKSLWRWRQRQPLHAAGAADQEPARLHRHDVERAGQALHARHLGEVAQVGALKETQGRPKFA